MQRTFNPKTVGSNPTHPTFIIQNELGHKMLVIFLVLAWTLIVGFCVAIIDFECRERRDIANRFKYNIKQQNGNTIIQYIFVFTIWLIGLLIIEIIL